MSFYKVKEDANYCGYNEEYLIKSDKPLADVEAPTGQSYTKVPTKKCQTPLTTESFPNRFI